MRVVPNPVWLVSLWNEEIGAQTHPERENDIKRQGEDSPWEETNPANNFISDFQPPESQGRYISVV